MPTAIIGLDRARPSTVVKPMIELGGALHVLDDPGHHDAVEWAEGIRARLSPALADATAKWAWTTRAIRSTPFVVPEVADLDAEDLLRPVVRSAAASRGPAVQALLDRPAEAVAEFRWFRRGRYVQYRLDTTAVERLGSDLVRLLVR